MRTFHFWNSSTKIASILAIVPYSEFGVSYRDLSVLLLYESDIILSDAMMTMKQVDQTRTRVVISWPADKKPAGFLTNKRSVQELLID